MKIDKENQRLDKLADELSGFVDGWELGDVARVCASLAAAAIAMQNGTPLKRAHALEQITDFMNESMQRMAKHLEHMEHGEHDRRH